MDKNAYLALIDEVRKHMRLYYDMDEPQISDHEYDTLMQTLKEAEKEHPEWISSDSPTQVVGASAGFAASEDAAGSREKGGSTGKRTAGVLVTHDVPMLSIEDVFSKEDVLEWVHEVRAMHPDARFVVDEKIDGLSMSLRYENGRLVLAETRGDGFMGEDVTPNARVIPDVVQKLKATDAYLELRGEVYMRHDDFERTNAAQEALGKKTFANPRNCAAGTLRQLDSSMVKERGLSFFVFNVQKASDETRMVSHSGALKRLEEEEGIRVAPSVVCETDEEILTAIDRIGERRGILEYDIDGAVIKLDRIAWRSDFPAGSKYSAGHIAYKYPPEEKEAVITDIELSVGMTGRINPTAVFSPVRLCGTSVSRATLHNQDFIDKLGIGIGKTVLVYKSGEIIPKIRGTVKDGRIRTEEDGVKELAAYEGTTEAYRGERGIFSLPETCPVCGAKVVRGRSAGPDAEDTDAADLYCGNPDCPAKLTRRVIHFVSRDAMDIKGFGTEYITKLIAGDYIRNIDDIYTLKQHRDALVEQGIIGKDKNTDKLLDVIEQSKKNEPWRLLAGLAIANVGRTGARTLMRHFGSLEALAEADEETLTQVPDIGGITAQGIRDWFADPAHRRLLENLKEAGVNLGDALSGNSAHAGAQGGASPDPETGGSGQPLAGRTYVVTGDLVSFKNRDELIDFIEARGGRVAGSVSKKTYALINNDAASTSGKNRKAAELGIPILTEDAFLASVQGNGS